MPELDEPTAAAISARVRAAILALEAEGVAVRWLESYALVAEETYFCFVDARARGHVASLNRCAGLEAGHVAEVVALGPRKAK